MTTKDKIKELKKDIADIKAAIKVGSEEEKEMLKGPLAEAENQLADLEKKEKQEDKEPAPKKDKKKQEDKEPAPKKDEKKQEDKEPAPKKESNTITLSDDLVEGAKKLVFKMGGNEYRLTKSGNLVKVKDNKPKPIESAPAKNRRIVTQSVGRVINSAVHEITRTSKDRKNESTQKVIEKTEETEALLSIFMLEVNNFIQQKDVDAINAVNQMVKGLVKSALEKSKSNKFAHVKEVAELFVKAGIAKNIDEVKKYKCGGVVDA